MTTHTIHRQSTATTRMISGISVALEVGSCKSANGFGEVKLEVVNALSQKNLPRRNLHIHCFTHISLPLHRTTHQSFDLDHFTVCIAASELYCLLTVRKPQGVDMSDTTASALTPKEDAAAKQSEQMSTGSQTVDNHLKAGSHASQAQVRLTAMHAGAALQELYGLRSQNVWERNDTQMTCSLFSTRLTMIRASLKQEQSL